MPLLQVLCIRLSIKAARNKTRTKPNGDCIFNSYKDGDLCRDCPTGYYGTNCTDKCKHPTFGRLCSETCDCSVCHHILGCISTAVNIADASTTALTGTSFTFTGIRHVLSP
uniref:Uncharacterized protein n=1 Tax=Magallana gigas TaxID=29159 RepID=A0A8W8LWG7_MAGGI